MCEFAYLNVWVTLTTSMTDDVSHLANGMYFLKVDNKVVKFVKE
jgi:hypothetical protein